MASIQKTLQNWENGQDEVWKTVEAVLKKYGFQLAGKPGGSHNRYVHPTLREALRDNPCYFKDYAPTGQIIVIKHGEKVFNQYLRRILKAIADIDFYNSVKDCK